MWFLLKYEHFLKGYLILSTGGSFCKINNSNVRVGLHNKNRKNGQRFTYFQRVEKLKMLLQNLYISIFSEVLGLQKAMTF